MLEQFGILNPWIYTLGALMILGSRVDFGATRI